MCYTKMEKLLIEMNLMETSEGSKQQKANLCPRQTLKLYGRKALRVIK